MVECICIDAANRPEVIRTSKWLKKGEPYTILFTTLVLPQRQIGAVLAEIELTDNELPYEFFLLSRFAFTEENIRKLEELIRDCNNTHFSMDELLQQTTLVDS